MRKPVIGLLLLLLTVVPTAYAQTQFSLEVSLGQVPGWDFIHKFGHLEAIPVTESTIWSNGTIYPFLDAPTLMNISSSDIDDDLFDTGAWNVTIEGLDANYVRQNETIVMDGQTPVSSVNTYLRVHRAYVRKSGASESNEGTIYLGTGVTVAGVPVNVYAQIEPDTAAKFTGYGQTQMAVYTVPANKTALLTDIDISSVQQKTHEFYLMIRPFNESWRRISEFHFESFTFEDNYHPSQLIEARTDIMATVIGEQPAGGAASFSFNIYLIDYGFETIPDQGSSSNNVLLYLLLAALIFVALGGVYSAKR